MSLESEIKALTAAINRWCDTMTAPAEAPRVTEALSIPNDKPLEGGAVNSPAIVGNPAPVAFPNTDAQQVEESLRAEMGSAEPPTFDDAKRAFLAIAQKYGAVEGTAKSKEVLSRYGVPNLKALGAEQYPDFIALCGTVVEGGAA